MNMPPDPQRIPPPPPPADWRTIPPAPRPQIPPPPQPQQPASVYEKTAAVFGLISSLAALALMGLVLYFLFGSGIL